MERRSFLKRVMGAAAVAVCGGAGKVPTQDTGPKITWDGVDVLPAETITFEEFCKSRVQNDEPDPLLDVNFTRSPKVFDMGKNTWKQMSGSVIGYSNFPKYHILPHISYANTALTSYESCNYDAARQEGKSMALAIMEMQKRAQSMADAQMAAIAAKLQREEDERWMRKFEDSMWGKHSINPSDDDSRNGFTPADLDGLQFWMEDGVVKYPKPGPDLPAVPACRFYFDYKYVAPRPLRFVCLSSHA